jgi:putative DNA primase/helicase
MRGPDIAELKARIPLSALIGEAVKLTQHGAEYIGLCPFHNEQTPSFTIYRDDKGAERYKCFGCGRSGDHLDWLQAHKCFTRREAITELRTRSGEHPPLYGYTPPTEAKVERWQSVPPPANQPPPSKIWSNKHKRLLPVSASWAYRDASGALLAYRCRIEQDGKKQIITLLWSAEGRWRQRTLPNPKPLYGLEFLASNPEARILIAEGEKATDAGRRLLSGDEGDWLALSWADGSNAFALSDWTPLAGREVVIWPDNDAPGEAAALAIADILKGLGCAVRIVCPKPTWPKGYDLADLEADAWTRDQMCDYMRHNLRTQVRIQDDGQASDATHEEPDNVANVDWPQSPQEVNEDRLAQVFEELHADELRYCHTTGAWFRWEESRWRKDDKQYVLHLVREVCRRASWRKAPYLKQSTVSAIERLARPAPGFAATTDLWDRDPWLLGTPGGTVNLRTGELQAAIRTDFITRQTSVPPAPAGCKPTRWLNFLNDATNGDAELIRYLQQIAGYVLTGATSEHVLFFIYGLGGNGKTVFLNTLTAILSEYAQTAAMDTFTASKYDRHPTDLAMLKGARLVTASETEEGRKWAEAKIKQMTGGDPITARFMRRDYFTYQPEFKLVIIGNHKPCLDNVDDAMRRRLNIIPFTNKPSTPDPDLESKLREEWPAILRWMIEGCLDWQQNGFLRPNVVSDATSSYFEDQDLLGQWLNECCEPRANYKESHKTLFGSWTNYAKTAGEEPGSKKAFTEKMVNRGFERWNKNDDRGLYGLKVKHPPALDDPRDPCAWD